MKTYFYSIKIFTYRILILMLFLTLSRLYFYFANFQYFNGEEFRELLIAFTHGLRFDISSVAIFNFVFIILSLIPFNIQSNRKFQTLLKILFIVVNSILMFANFVDSEYFKFTNKRSTFDIFSMITTGYDFINLIPVFLKDYWFTVVVWAIMVLTFLKIYPKYKVLDNSRIDVRKILFQIPISLIVLGLFFVAWRGIELRPLSIIHATKYANSHNISLVLNTPFTIVRTMNKQDLIKKDYFSDDSLYQFINPVKKPNQKEKFKALNVVIIIMESFGSEYINFLNHTGKSYTPFLDSIFEHSLVFTNAFANGKKSMEALPSIISSIPSLMDNPYITSTYISNKLNSLPNLLRKENYSSSFFHGGTNGTMGFDYFAKVTEFDNYYGRKEFNNEIYFDGNWGIYDEEFLQYTSSVLTSFKPPFFACLFTLSSHHPYTIPAKYDSIFKGGKYEILKSIQYTDFALQKFFEKSEKENWFKNTLFVFTADHTSLTSDRYFVNNVGKYSVPIAFYCAGDTSLKGKSNIVAQHIDIMPTILSYLNFNHTYFSLGDNMLESDSAHFNITYLNGIYQIIENDYVLNFDGEKIISLYNYKRDKYLLFNLVKKNQNQITKMSNKLKAFIQIYNNNIIANKMYVE